jgi:hypothetical protein
MQVNQRQKRTLILTICGIVVVAFWELIQAKNSQSGKFNWEGFTIEAFLIVMLGLVYFIRRISN